MEASQIWVEKPHQQQNRVSLVPYQEPEVHVDAYISESRAVEGSLNSLMFNHPSSTVNAEFLQRQKDQPHSILHIPSPSELQYWDLKQ